MAPEPDTLPAVTEGMDSETAGFGPHASSTLQESDTEYKEPRWWFINLRCSDEDRKLIDRACAELGCRRSHFALAAALERARHVLAAKGAP